MLIDTDRLTNGETPAGLPLLAYCLIAARGGVVDYAELTRALGCSYRHAKRIVAEARPALEADGYRLATAAGSPRHAETTGEDAGDTRVPSRDIYVPCEGEKSAEGTPVSPEGTYMSPEGTPVSPAEVVKEERESPPPCPPLSFPPITPILYPPYIPPAKEKEESRGEVSENSDKKMSFQTEETIEASSDEDTREATAARPRPAPVQERTRHCVAAWVTTYRELTGERWQVQPMDAAALRTIGTFIADKMDEGRDDPERVAENARIFFRAAYRAADQWQRDNFSPTMLAKKRNEIYNKLKNRQIHGNNVNSTSNQDRNGGLAELVQRTAAALARGD